MTETVRVKPAPDLKVRYEDPSRGHIPAEGADVPRTRYYRTLLRDGDLVEADPPKPEAPPKPKAASKREEPAEPEGGAAQAKEKK